MGSHFTKRKKPSETPTNQAEDPEQHEPPATDPRLPLTAREVFRLTSSWKAIKRNMEATGVEMFINFFKTNTDLQTKFQGFKQISLDDSAYENEALSHHARLVMGALDRAISNLNDVDQVYNICNRVGSSHRRFDGFNADLFVKIQDPFLQAVKLTLGDRYNENMERIYRITASFLIGEIAKGYTHHQANTVQSQVGGSKEEGENDLNKNQTSKAGEKFGENDFDQSVVVTTVGVVGNGKEAIKDDKAKVDSVANVNKQVPVKSDSKANMGQAKTSTS